MTGHVSLKARKKACVGRAVAEKGMMGNSGDKDQARAHAGSCNQGNKWASVRKNTGVLGAEE